MPRVKVERLRCRAAINEDDWSQTQCRHPSKGTRKMFAPAGMTDDYPACGVHLRALAVDLYIPPIGAAPARTVVA